MTKEKVKAVLDRVSTWPEERQQELAELALEIEAELAGAPYRATSDELKATDDGLTGDTASAREVVAAFEKLRGAWHAPAEINERPTQPPSPRG